MKNAIIFLLEFISIQYFGGLIVSFIWNACGGSTEPTTAKLITMSCVVSVLTIILFLLTRAAKVSPNWLRTRPWAVLCWSSIAALGAIIPSEWLQEQLPELPNLVEQEFDMILRNRWGYLAVGLLAPLSEELVLRGAILRSLLHSSKLSPWGAIAISAVFFALVHFNPVQMPHAFLVGLLLGWMYYRTGSILPGVAFHWVNNTVAYFMYNFYPDPHLDLIKFFGNQRTIMAAILFSLFILVPALYQLHLRMQKAE